MRLMAGLDQPSAGQLIWDGQDVTGHARAGPQRCHGLSAVHQLSRSDGFKTSPRRCASLGLPMRSTASVVRNRRNDAPDADVLTRKPLELSGGQQQRCAAGARAGQGRNWSTRAAGEPLDYKLREELRSRSPASSRPPARSSSMRLPKPEEARCWAAIPRRFVAGCVTRSASTLQVVYREPVDATTAQRVQRMPMNFVGGEKPGELATPPAPQTAQALPAVADGAYQAGFRANHPFLNCITIGG